MRIVLISDTHSRHREITVPAGDVLIHAGDFSGWSTLDDVRDFARWMGDLPHRHKLCTAGNHDKSLDTAFRSRAEGSAARFVLGTKGVHYLQDSPCIIPHSAGWPLSVWGSPYQPPFFRWAFQEPEELLAQRWRRIPAHTDILVTHGPAHGYGDLNEEGEHCGSRSLRDWLEAHAKVRPIPLHVCGHIHEAAGQGVYPWGGRWVNASVLNRRYEVANAPVVVEFEAGEVAA